MGLVEGKESIRIPTFENLHSNNLIVISSGPLLGNSPHLEHADGSIITIEAAVYFRLIARRAQPDYKLISLMIKTNSLPSKTPLDFLGTYLILHASCLMSQALPALPDCIISPECGSFARKTGQPVPSAFASVNSSFVPMTLNSHFSGTMSPKSTIVS